MSGINDAKSKNQRASDTKLSKIFESTAKGILGKDIPWALQTEAADDLRNASKRLSDAADEIKMTFSRMGLPDQIKKIQEISIEAQKGDKYAQAQLAASMDLIKNFAKDINTKEMMDGTFDILNRIREEEIKGNFIATGKNVIEIAEGLGSGNAVLKGMVTDIHTQEYKAERMNYGKQKNFDNFDRDHLIEIVANDKDAMKKLMDQINRSIAEATTDIEREQLNIIKDNLNSNDNKDKARGILMATGGGDLHKIQSGPKPLGGNDGIFVNTTHEQYFKKRMNNVQEIIDSTDKTFEEKKSAVDGFLTDGGDWSLMKQGLSGNREVIEAQKKFKDRITRLERDPKVKADQKSKETKETIEHLQKEVEE
ncbi:MAG: hypothetical protein U9Q15_04145 [Patescibacteria group bacterium]|nr:hypothetical protein [Patescibacteria group bacterium]